MASTLTHRRMAMGCIAVLVATFAFVVTTSSFAEPLTLPAALERALASHPDLRLAVADLAVARADSMYAGRPAFNPQLELQGSRSGGSTGGGSDHSVGLAVSQEVELGGKRVARRSVAVSRSQTSAAEWRAMAQEITSRVRAQFEHALFLQERISTLGELAELDRRVVRASQARVRDGSITPVTGRLSELDLLRLEAQAMRVRSELRQAIGALGLAVGSELADTTRLSGEFAADSLLAPEDSVVAMALRTRGRGEVLRRQIAERRAQLRLAEAEAHPNLTVGAGIDSERRSFSGADFAGDPAIVRGITGVSATENAWSARVSVPLPLWQKNEAARARAASEIARSEAAYDRYRLQARLEVLGAVRRFQDATTLYRFYLDRSDKVRPDLVLIRGAYADGRIPLDSYLTQKGRLVDTLLGQLEAGDAYWDARGQLETAAGLGLDQLNAGGAR